MKKFIVLYFLVLFSFSVTNIYAAEKNTILMNGKLKLTQAQLLHLLVILQQL